MTDIVKRLREPPFGTETSERNIMTAAADEIERLRAENTSLRTELQNLVECLELAQRNSDVSLPFAGYGEIHIAKAREALNIQQPIEK